MKNIILILLCVLPLMVFSQKITTGTPADGTETKVNSGVGINVSGVGSISNPYIVWADTSFLATQHDLTQIPTGIDTFNVQSGNLQLSLQNDNVPAYTIPVTNIAPLQGLTAGAGIGLSGLPNVTITNTGDLSNTNELQTISYSAPNLTLSGGGGSVAIPQGTVTGSIADQQVAFGSGSDISGTPTFLWNDTEKKLSVGLSSKGYVSIFQNTGWSQAITAGSLEFGSYATNNAWFGDNLFFSAGWNRRSAGAGSLFYFLNGGFQYRTTSSGASGTATLSTKLWVLNNGDVGIGVSPSARLHVVGAGTTSGTWTAQFHNSANNNALMIRDDGLIGIGTSSLSARLQVKGSSSVSGAYGLILEKGDGTDYLIGENNGDVFLPLLNGTGDQLAYLTSTGKLQRSTVDIATLPTVSGTTGFFPVFTGTNSLGNSATLQQSGSTLIGNYASGVWLRNGTIGLVTDFVGGNVRLYSGVSPTLNSNTGDLMLQPLSGTLRVGTTVDSTSKVVFRGLASGTPILKMEDNTGAAKYVFENDGSFIAATLAGPGTQLAQILSTGELSRSSVDVSALITTSTTAGGDLSGPISNLQIEPGVVTSTEILNGTIALADMGSSSVNSAIIIDGSVGALDLNPQSATTGQIMRYAGIGVGWTPGDVGGVVSGPVTNLALADNTVTSGKIVNGSIQPVDLFFSSYSLGSTMYSDGSSWLWGQNRWEGYNDANLGGGTGTVALSSNRIDNLVRGSAWTSLTLQLPALPSDGQLTAVTFDVAATSITWDGSGKTIVGTLPATITVGDSFYFKYYAATDKWYRIKF